MELFKLLGTIAIDNDKAVKALDDTSKKGKDTESKLGKAFSSLGKGALAVGKAVGAGMVAAGTAVAGLVTQSTQSYAEYEQLVGGVETLFKDSSGKVMEFANKAFQTAGMSANAYMDTVTSFSASLLQSLEWDTSAAAEKANVAITDMSDNANKMGTSMEMIQNAYQGFAKQNYTMLDNLKLGYGGTKEEMQRLLLDAEKLMGLKAYSLDMTNFSDVVDAIHAVQTEMGITGTTAKEASGTISGSVGSVSAAWQNLVTAMADDNADFGSYVTAFVDSAQTVVSNMIPRIGIALNGVVELIKQLAPVIIGAIPGLLSELLPAVITAAVDLVNAVVGAIPSLIEMIVTSVIPNLLTGVVSIFESLVKALPTLIQTLASALPTLIPLIIDSAVQMVLILCQNLPSIIQPLVDNLPSILENLINAIISNVPLLVQGLIDLVIALIPMIPVIMNTLLDAFLFTFIGGWTNTLISMLPMLLEGLWMIIVELVKALPGLLLALLKSSMAQIIAPFYAIFTALTTLWQPLSEWFNTNVIQPLSTIFSGLWEHIKGVWDGICTAVQIAFQLIASIIDAAFQIITLPFRFIWENCKDTITSVWKAIKKNVSDAIDAVKGIITVVFNAIKTYFETVFGIYKSIFTAVFGFIKDTVTTVVTAVKTVITTVFGAIKDYITTVLGFYKTIFKTVWGAIKTTVTTVVGNIKDRITTVFNAVKTTVTTIFGAIKDKMTKPIEKARDTIKDIVDKIKGFFSGMKLEFPDIKTPHFGITPKGWEIGDLLKGSVPKLKIDWYAKAMDNPMIMTRPTIFGYNGATGELMGGGEAGSEVVSGTNTLMQMIQGAVAAQNETLVYYLENLTELLVEYCPAVLEQMQHPIPAVVGVDQAADALAEPINYRMGRIAMMKNRGGR